MRPAFLLIGAFHMSQQDPIVIVSVARTPMGGMQGVLSPFSANQLGSVAIKAAVARAGIAPGDVEEVIMGNCLPAGQGQAPARQALRGAGVPDSAGALTINKMCGSGMKAIMLAHDLLKAGSNKVIVAGGMESMTNAPYLLLKARGGYRYGHAQMYDHTAMDGLEDAYERGTAMGVFAERTVEQYGFTRKDQDDYAIESLARAQRAELVGRQRTDQLGAQAAYRGGGQRGQVVGVVAALHDVVDRVGLAVVVVVAAAVGGARRREALRALAGARHPVRLDLPQDVVVLRHMRIRRLTGQLATRGLRPVARR